MHSLTVNGGQLVGALIGFGVIHWLANTPRYRALLWPFTIAWGAGLAAFLFSHTNPDVVFNDFRRCYWLAGHLVWQGPQALSAAYDPHTLVFVNIPIVAYLFAPFGLLAPMPAAIAFLALGVGIVALIWRMLTTHYELDARESAFVAFGLMMFGPLLYSLREGNTSHHVLALLLGGLVLMRAKREALAGAAFGLAALIKPALVLIGILYLLRGRWRVVAAGAATLAGAAGLSLLIFGWDMHVRWYDTSIAPYAIGPVPAYAVQTFQAMMLRFEIGGPAGHDWSAHALSAGGKLAAHALAGLALAGAAFAAWRSGRAFAPTARDLEVETLLVIAFVLIASPLSWAHYYVWLAPAFALALTRTRASSAEARLRWPLAGAFALAAPVAFVSEQMSAGRFGALANIVASHWMLAGAAMFALLAYLRARRSAP